MLGRRVAVPVLTAAALSTTCLVPCLLRRAREAKKARQKAVLEQRRLKRNQARSKRGRANRAHRKAAERAERQELLDAMSTEERERELEGQEAKRAARLARQAAQEERVRTALASGQRICIDLSFDAEMSEKENRSLAKQVELSTVANKTSECPCALTLTNFDKDNRFGTLLRSMAGNDVKWPINLENRPAWAAYSPEQLVYLTPDAPDILTELDPAKVYCIGGLVDRSVSRHMTATHAASQGVAAMARLPLREHCRMHNNALNIDTVVKILLEFRACNDWKQALEAVVPKRRRVKQPGESDTAETDVDVSKLCPESEWLWVGGIPLDEKHDDCAAAAAKACVDCGAIDTSFAPDCNFGFAQFGSVEAATAARMRLHRLVRDSHIAP